MIMLVEFNFELLLGAFLFLLVLAVMMLGLAHRHAHAWQNLPLVADDVGLDARIAEKRQRVADLDTEISARQSELKDIPDAQAELRYLESRRDEIKAEIAAMADDQARVEALQRELQEAVEKRARAVEELQDAERDLAEKRATADAMEERRRAADAAIHELEERDRRLREEIDKLKGQLEELDANRREVERLRAEKTEIEDAKTRLNAEVAQKQAALDDVNHRLQAGRAEAAQIDEQREESRRLAQELADRRRDLEEVVNKREAEQARVAALEERREELRRETGGPGGGRQHDGLPDERVLADLRKVPPCLEAPAIHTQRAPLPEPRALHLVQESLSANKLVFDERVVRAFHTSLKVNDLSPLTVLAGVSGTGKSQLPRRYAEAMGLSFLHVAVQPRWDSPQDLLGFYNYIEQRYRATELAQALVHLDTFNWKETSEPYANRMLLVLLDEMNLARVEYYFSEFLSRLEVRPPPDRVDDQAEREPAQIPIDVRGTTEARPFLVFPGYNVLFVGTMNEDESTLALSDKVLDRSNVMQFGRPKEFEPNVPATTASAASEGWLAFEDWRSWIRKPNRLQGAERDKVRTVVNELADLMGDCGRAFGFRLSQSITSYVANYPGDRGPDVDQALADQIEMRILPKLRGLEVEPHQETLRKLADLTRSRVGDAQLALTVENAIERGQHTGLFAWRGRER
jgi:hypothetical protein